MMYTRPERKGLVGEATCLSDEEGKRCVCVHSIVRPVVPEQKMRPDF